jgi:hypothetical protein
VQARDLPFNRYAWLTTHNSFARLGTRSRTGTAIATAWNQQDTITDQLNVSPFLSFALPNPPRRRPRFRPFVPDTPRATSDARAPHKPNN